jgi:transcriptional regulator with XRE-family HTH domain
MGHARQTFERRQLGLTLRKLRDDAGRTQQEAADALGKVRSRVVALEDGSATATQADLAVLLDCYRVFGAERETLLALAAHARRRTKRRAYVDVLPEAYTRFADLEASAAEIDCYEQGVVPGLLQSPSYVQALLAECDGVWWSTGSVEGPDRLAFRLARQTTVFQSELERTLRFVVTEDALRANVGGREVMRDQLAHLRLLLVVHPDLSVRVLRRDTYGNPMRGNSVLIFGFGDRGAPIAHSGAVLGPSTYYEDERDTTVLRHAFERVWDIASDPADSRRLIERILEET